MGDPLNNALLESPTGDRTRMGFWPLAAGGAVANGVAVENLPDLKGMFAHIASQLGSDSVKLRVGTGGQPALPPGALLQHVWPLAEMCFSGKFPGATMEFGNAPVMHRPAICGYIANQYIGMAKAALAPQTALTIAMEAAIFCSKIKYSDWATKAT